MWHEDQDGRITASARRNLLRRAHPTCETGDVGDGKWICGSEVRSRCRQECFSSNWAKHSLVHESLRSLGREPEMIYKRVPESTYVQAPF